MSPKPELRPVKPETDTETDPLIEADLDAGNGAGPVRSREAEARSKFRRECRRQKASH